MTINYDVIKQLAKKNNLKVQDLCALAPKNDPFYTGRNSEVIASEWFTDLWQRFGYDRGVHLRRIHYRIVSQDPPVARPDGSTYENTQRDWDYLNEASKWARYLNMVPPESFVDRRNPDAILHARWYSPSDVFFDDPTPRFEVQNFWDDDDFFLPDLPELPDLPNNLPNYPDFSVEGYQGIQQNFHIEIWCEKTTMNDILEPLCREYGANLVTGAGEMSITSVVEFLRRVRLAGRPSRIIYISDFDPAGLGMPISVARKIEYFQRNEGHNDLDIRLQPLLLTADQVVQYRLPRVPVKDTDLRKESFEAAYGQGQVELDALEALYPGELADIVEKAILQFYDPTLESRARERRRELAQALDDARDLILNSYDDDLSELNMDYTQLIDDFSQTQQRFNDLVRDFQPEIEQHEIALTAIKDRASELYSRIAADLEDRDLVDVDIDEYALPEPRLPVEPDDTLYNSGRDYLAQLVSYKAHRFGGDNHDD